MTNQNNQTWRNIQWGENITNQEDNPNFHFKCYDDLSIATYMYPAYEGYENPHIWEAIGEGESRSQTGFCNKYAKLTTLKEIQYQNPTIEQRITLAILCSLNLVLNPLFRKWGIDYLRKIDQTPETAHKLSEELTKQENLPLEHQYIDCTFATLAAVMLSEKEQFAANAIHRAYFDGIDLEQPLDLTQMADIVNSLEPEQIADFLDI